MKRAALLRAVNVGGRQVKMAELREMLAGTFGEVRTLMASGNVVLESSEATATLEARLEAAFQARFGFLAEFLIRDGTELDAIIGANPFPSETRDHPAKVAVTFFRDAPDPGVAERLASEHDGPERAVLIGRELYVDYPVGLGVSTLERTMRRLRWPRLATTRNWNTVLKLRAALD